MFTFNGTKNYKTINAFVPPHLLLLLLLFTFFVAETITAQGIDDDDIITCKVILNIAEYEEPVNDDDDEGTTEEKVKGKNTQLHHSHEHKHLEYFTCELIREDNSTPSSSSSLLTFGKKTTATRRSSSNYHITFPQTIYDEFRRRIYDAENVILSIANPVIIVNDDDETQQMTIVVDNENDIELRNTIDDDSSSNNKDGHLRRDLQPSTPRFQRTILIVRVIALDSQPTLSAEELYRYVFNDDDGSVSLKRQMNDCSGGQVIMEPEPLFDGLLEVYINLIVAASTYETVVEESKRAAAIRYFDLDEDDEITIMMTDIREAADHVMLVLPAGNNYLGDAPSASAEVNGELSIYHDLWGGRISALMHEVGHNLRLRHAYHDNVEYEDRSGYMGSSQHEFSSPLKCYNGVNFAQLGWFQHRTTIIDPSKVAPTLATLTAFVDYNKTANDNDETVLLRGGDLSMVYNRAKRHNIGTGSTHANQMTVVRETELGTNLLAGLDRDRNPTFKVVEHGHEILFEICDEIVIDEATNKESMIVSIGPGTKASLCDEYRNPTTTSTSQGGSICAESYKCDGGSFWYDSYWMYLDTGGGMFGCVTKCVDQPYMLTYRSGGFQCGTC